MLIDEYLSGLLLWSMSSTFYAHIYRESAFFAEILSSKPKCNKRKAARSTFEKCVCKMLMKLTPRINFINILRTTFMLVGHKSVKNTAKS